MEQRTAEQLSAALEGLVARFATMVRSVGARHRLSESDLDEVLQEVRIRLWRADPRGEQIERVGASYVYRTAVSAALDLLRRRRAHAADRTDSVDDLSERLPSRHHAARDLEADELGARILGAVDSLHASRRVVVRMYLSGYDREEIAELLGWTEAKTRNLLYRGLADLRTRLAAMGITPGESER
jgi:RNA polymerase sigma-70 factor (ECF subfamily)